jgi:hypothetical protein
MDPGVRILIDDAFKRIHSTDGEFDTAIVNFTLRSFGLRSNLATPKQLYADLEESCSGHLQPISRVVGRGCLQLTIEELGGPRVQTGLLEHKMRECFHSSFCAPHKFTDAGHER